MSNGFGKKYLVEQCQKIKISDFIKDIKGQIEEKLLRSSVKVESCEVLIIKSETGLGGFRYFFKCPLCHRRTGILYKHPISQILGCRTCLRLDYRKHRYNKMIESK